MTKTEEAPRAAASRNKKKITVLYESDVLLGRGKGFSSYIGNQSFLSLIEERKGEYNATDDNTEKASIARQVLKVVKGRGGRFLRLANDQEKVKDIVNGGVWYQVADYVSVEKIKQALRQKRASERNRKPRAQNGIPLDGIEGQPPIQRMNVTHSSLNQGIANAALLSSMTHVPATGNTFALGGGIPMSTFAPFQAFGHQEVASVGYVPLSSHPLFLPPPQVLESSMQSFVDPRLLLFQRAMLNFQQQQQLAANAVQLALASNPIPTQNLNLNAMPQVRDSLDRTRTADTTATSVPDDGVSESFLSMFGIDSRQPRVTEEQAELEKAQMSGEERAAALADMFGKNCSIDTHPPNKRARKDLDADDIGFLISQMRLEIDLIPLNEKEALMEAQAKCSRAEEEFSDKRLECFLRCEGMNTKVG